MKIEDVTS